MFHDSVSLCLDLPPLPGFLCRMRNSCKGRFPGATVVLLCFHPPFSAPPATSNIHTPSKSFIFREKKGEKRGKGEEREEKGEEDEGEEGRMERGGGRERTERKKQREGDVEEERKGK